MTTSRWDTVSITAHFTSQVWVRQSLPWAWRFDTARGRAFHGLTRPLFEAASRAGITSPLDFLVQRQRIIDRLVERLQPARLIELACGLSPRCLAYSHKYGIPCVDADLDRMVQLRRSLCGHGLPGSYRLAPLDLVASGDYARDLGGALQVANGPTVVITEGLLAYFPMELKQRLFRQVARLLRQCGGGTYLVDVHHQDATDELGGIATLFRWGMGLVSRTRQRPMIASPEMGQQLLRDAGFAQVAHHYPHQFQRELGLPLRRRDAGLCIYEAST